jgi:hypothetical protein
MNQIGQVVARQGDVPLVIAQLPKSAKRIAVGKAILAYGEVTGHHHRFESGAVMYADGDDRYVEVPQGSVTTIKPTAVELFDERTIRVFDPKLGLCPDVAVRMPIGDLAKIENAIKESASLSFSGSLLRHEEHDAIIAEPQVYKSPGQREYTSADMEPIRVAD